MADFRSVQRVRLYDGTNDIGFAAANALYVQLTDGTDTALIDGSGNVNVILAANSGVDIGDVDVTSVPAPLNVVGGGTEAAALRVTIANDSTGLVSVDDGGGSITVDGTVAVTGGAIDDAAFTVAVDGVTVMGGFADETAPDSVGEGDQGALRMTLDRKLLTRVVGASDANRLDIDASGYAKVILQANSGVDIGDVDVTSVPAPLNVTGGGTEASALRVTLANDSTGVLTVDASALDIRTITKATDSIQISKDTSANSETNPIYVASVDTIVSASEVHDQSTGAAVVKDASSNHDYTVTGTNMLLKSVICSASGAGKYEVQTGPLASLVTKAVQFGSGANPNVVFKFDPPIEVPVTSTGTIRVIRRNDDNQAQDMYSTIVGNDV